MEKFTTLVLATATFPFGGHTEQAFLLPEIAPLAAQFSRVIIVPTQVGESGTPVVDLPANVEVVNSVAATMARRLRRLRYLFHPMIGGAALDATVHLHNPLSAATYAASALAWKKEMERLIEERNLDEKSTVLYSFWFDYPATGMALLADERGYRVVSRIHGYEMRDLRSPMLKKLTMANLHALYPVSKAATDFMRRTYQADAERISLRHLGSDKTDMRMLGPLPDEEAHELNFISVARVIPLKRVDMILELMKQVAAQLPSYRINWTHIGDGELLVELTHKLAKGLPANLKVELTGARSNSYVHQLFSSRPFHWNLLLSSTEGGVPIALCEGASYGVPAVATDVGGIGELIDTSTGIPVDADPDLMQTAAKIIRYLSEPDAYRELRSAIYERWSKRFAAERLRRDFAAEIATIKPESSE